MDISNKLKSIRTNKGYSVYKLAKQSEISSTYIHELEKGKKQPTVEVLKKLCDSLDISLCDFFKETSPSYTPKQISVDQVIKEIKELNPAQLQAIYNIIKVIK